MLIMNTGLFWFSLAVISTVLYRHIALRVAFVIFCGFLPPIFGLIGTIWKDVGMHSFFLCALALSLRAQHRRQWQLLLASTLFLWMAGSYRHNAFVASVPLIILNTWIAIPLLAERYPRLAAKIRRRQLGRACAVGGTLAVCGVLSSGISFVNNYGVEDVALWRSTLIHDLVGISVCRGSNVLPEGITRQSQVSIEDLRKIYVGHHLSSIFDPDSRKFLGAPDPTSTAVVKIGDAREVLKAWLIAASNDPGCYLYHRIQVAQKLLVVEAGNPWYPFHQGIAPNKYGITFTPSALTRWVTSWLQFTATATYLYSAWIYVMLLVIALFVAWLVPFRYSLPLQLVAASGLIYALTNVAMAASADFRYNNWCIGACCLCIGLGAAGLRTQEIGRGAWGSAGG
jgi:hypothetical protein